MAFYDPNNRPKEFEVLPVPPPTISKQFSEGTV